MTDRPPLTPLDVAKLSDDPPRRRTRADAGNSMIGLSVDPVAIRGESLGEIWWRGSQWAVTDYGIECLDGSYAIEKTRLRENLPRYSWPEHMAGKNWVSVDEFSTAWMVAMILHDPKIGPELRTVFERLPP